MSKKISDLLKEKYYNKYQGYSITMLCSLFSKSKRLVEKEAIAKLVSEKAGSEFELFDQAQLDAVIDFMSIDLLRNLANNKDFDTYRHQQARKKVEIFNKERTLFEQADKKCKDIIKLEQYYHQCYMNLDLDQLCQLYLECDNNFKKQFIIHAIAYKEPDVNEVVDMDIMKKIINSMEINDLWNLGNMESNVFRCQYARILLEQIFKDYEIDYYRENRKYDLEDPKCYVK